MNPEDIKNPNVEPPLKAPSANSEKKPQERPPDAPCEDRGDIEEPDKKELGVNS